MSVIYISAVIECDSCGTQFKVDIDESGIPPENWSMWDVAEDAVRGSCGYEELHPPRGGSPLCSSVQQGRMLCAKCTAIEDNE